MNGSIGICGKRADIEEIRRAVSLFAFREPGDIAELRMPGSTKGTISGYFDDPEKLVEAAAELSGSFGASIYFTLNQVRRDLLARSANRITRYSRHTTKDNEILRRRWLPIDIDPVRPAGISSTDQEHEAAIALAYKLDNELMELGWPAGSILDSGNGAHILYGVDLPNDEHSAELTERVLKGLARRYNSPALEIDVRVFNAARIWKVPGTLVLKGDPTGERPHRLARIVRSA